MKLQNKIAVVTGGNSGIGFATAQEFRAQGAQVIIIGRNSEAVAKAAREIGGDTLGVTADVSRVAEIDLDPERDLLARLEHGVAIERHPGQARVVELERLGHAVDLESGFAAEPDRLQQLPAVDETRPNSLPQCCLAPAVRRPRSNAETTAEPPGRRATPFPGAGPAR